MPMFQIPIVAGHDVAGQVESPGRSSGAVCWREDYTGHTTKHKDFWFVEILIGEFILPVYCNILGKVRIDDKCVLASL